MEARSEILTAEDAAAKCLMLISRVGQNGVSEKRVFTCKTCMKEFPSFQALGGHRASHKKPSHGHSHSHDMAESPGSPKRPKTTSHACPICGLEFPMGQALGGHMRRHRNSNGGALVTRAFLPETTVMLKRSGSNGKRVSCLDLNLASSDKLNLKLELGRTTVH